MGGGVVRGFEIGRGEGICIVSQLSGTPAFINGEF